jgi:hypothetical protein
MKVKIDYKVYDSHKQEEWLIMYSFFAKNEKRELLHEMLKVENMWI